MEIKSPILFVFTWTTKSKLSEDFIVGQIDDITIKLVM